MIYVQIIIKSSPQLDVLSIEVLNTLYNLPLHIDCKVTLLVISTTILNQDVTKIYLNKCHVKSINLFIYLFTSKLTITLGFRDGN